MIRKVSSLVLLCFLITTVSRGQMKTLSVGPLTVAPGQVASGMIEIPAAADAGTRIPITVIHGVRPGPVLGLIAGNHGYEYPPVLALQRLRAGLNPSELAGAVILVHVANMPSFLGRTIYTNPVDRKNLNRVYPGRKDGTISERIAFALTHEVIERSDYLVDIHCGDGNESLRPYLYLPVTGRTDFDAKTRDFALAFGMDHIVLDRERPTDPQASIYCSTTAVTRGKPAITVESGYLGGIDEVSIDRLVRGCLGLMKQLQMVPGAPEPVQFPVYLDPYEVLTSPATGLLYPKVERGHSVAKGTLLATVTDFFGKILAEVRSPFAGIVLYVVATPPISQGEPVAMVAAVKAP
jgi:predicted deacylase